MRSLFENKRLVLVLGAFALLALTTLATSLNEVPFRNGQRFAQREAAKVQRPPLEVTETWVDIPLWKEIVFWSLVCLLVILVGLLLSPEARKRMFLLLIRVGFTVWGVYFLFKNYGEKLLGFQQLESAGAQQADGSVVPMPVFEPPPVSPTVSYLISYAFALFWLVVIWGLYRGWKKYFSFNTTKPIDEIAKIARSSLDELSLGRNSSDVIINCYLRMTDVVSDKRNLQRTIAMTPHEFALRLEQAGLPGDAVTRLTRLFEGVRYGDRKSGPKDITEAVTCLKTILHYCGEPV